jgi:hypothetical protein
VKQGWGLRDGVREHLALAAFTAVYVVGFLAYGLSEHRPSTLTYCATILVLSAIVARLHARVDFSPPVLWGLSLWGLAHVAGGLIPASRGVLYNVDLRIPTLHYDRVVHAGGFGVATVACWEGIRGSLRTRPITGGVAVLIALMGIGLGAINEVVEFIGSHVMAASNVGGYQNTGWDLVFNAIGCSAAAALVWVREHR